MSNLETTLGRFRKSWMGSPRRSHWPADLEPPPEQLDLTPEPLSFGFFLNADDTPRFGGPILAWPDPPAVVYRPLPAFRQIANEEQTWAA